MQCATVKISGLFEGQFSEGVDVLERISFDIRNITVLVLQSCIDPEYTEAQFCTPRNMASLRALHLVADQDQAARVLVSCSHVTAASSAFIELRGCGNLRYSSLQVRFIVGIEQRHSVFIAVDLMAGKETEVYVDYDEWRRRTREYHYLERFADDLEWKNNPLIW